MFPEETHQKIVKRIDDLEADAFRVYRGLERLRLELQRQWHVLPSGARWTESGQVNSEHSSQSAGIAPSAAPSQEPDK